MAEFGERGEVTIELDNRLQHVPLSPNEEIHVLQIVREAPPTWFAIRRRNGPGCA